MNLGEMTVGLGIGYVASTIMTGGFGRKTGIDTILGQSDLRSKGSWLLSQNFQGKTPGALDYQLKTFGSNPVFKTISYGDSMFQKGIKYFTAADFDYSEKHLNTAIKAMAVKVPKTKFSNQNIQTVGNAIRRQYGKAPIKSLGKSLHRLRIGTAMLRTTAALALIGGGSMLLTGALSSQKQTTQTRRYDSPYIAKRS